MTAGGFRLLREDETLDADDETVCVSTLLSGREDWHAVTPSWSDLLGKTVREVCDDHSDMDGRERLFRRRVQR